MNLLGVGFVVGGAIIMLWLIAVRLFFKKFAEQSSVGFVVMLVLTSITVFGGLRLEAVLASYFEIERGTGASAATFTWVACWALVAIPVIIVISRAQQTLNGTSVPSKEQKE